MINKRQYFDIQVNNESKIVDIFIYGVIGYGWYIEESRDAFEFVNEFKAAEKNASRINIHINSPGGLVEEGLPIFNVINASSVETHSYIDGIAYSMGAIIALAADKVHIAPNGLFLLHNASGWADGNAQAFRNVADELDKYDTALISSITSKTGLTEDQVREKWFDYKDHLFTAKEALEARLVDTITNEKASLPEDIVDWDLKKVHEYFSNDKTGVESDSFFNQILKKLRTALKTNSDTNTTDIMKELQKLVDAFNLTIEGELTVEKVIDGIQSAHQAELDKLTGERDQANTDLESANKTITQHTNMIDALGEEVADAADFPAKVQAIKGKLNAKPGSGPTVVDTVDPKPKDEVDWDAINQLEHNKAADQLV